MVSSAASASGSCTSVRGPAMSAAPLFMAVAGQAVDEQLVPHVLGAMLEGLHGERGRTLARRNDREVRTQDRHAADVARARGHRVQAAPVVHVVRRAGHVPERLDAALARGEDDVLRLRPLQQPAEAGTEGAHLLLVCAPAQLLDRQARLEAVDARFPERDVHVRPAATFVATGCANDSRARGRGCGRSRRLRAALRRSRSGSTTSARASRHGRPGARSASWATRPSSWPRRGRRPGAA